MTVVKDKVSEVVDDIAGGGWHGGETRVGVSEVEDKMRKDMMWAVYNMISVPL
jgi:hypothetical protein